MISVERAVVSGESVAKLLEIAHALAHKEGGCDERLILLAALAIKELEEVLPYLKDGHQKAVTDLAARLSFTAAGYAMELVGEIVKTWPEEQQKEYEAEQGKEVAH